MPIDYSKYPPKWKTEIRPRIMERAGSRCEVEGCGLEHGEIVSSFKDETGTRVWERQTLGEWYAASCPKRVKVVLTVAHLDHDETNHQVKDSRLMAMCQLHHLRYDAEEKKRRRNQSQHTEK